MKELRPTVIERLLGFKLLILSIIVLSLTLGKPAAIIAHQGTQKLCAFMMQTEDCSRHC